MDSESKTAEFTRLFNFFERLASHKSRSRTDDEDEANIDDIDSIPLPADLASVVNSLSKLVNNRIHNANEHQQKKTTGRKRSHTIATTSRSPREIDLDNSDEESVAKFPLGKKYTFTFRLMLHKLYQMDDWRQKVKEVLERSQNEYKPLSETIAAAEAKKQAEEEEEKNRKQDGRVHFKTGITGGSRKPGIRPRANSILALEKIKEGKAPSLHLRSPKSPTMPTMVIRSCPVAEDIRALKKRCVGRRKSLSGPLSTEGGRIGGNWIYDAEVSAAEVARQEDPSYQGVELGSPYQLGYTALGVVGSGGIVGKRHVSFEAPCTDGQAQKLDSGITKRRRALSVVDNLTPVQTLRKRPLES
ncbi:hypothetical protein C0995_002068 [Termitomyces sp. Mi166|nr:hypothetical protein C0995_002068 [Termitomyces sp. Mi166\